MKKTILTLLACVVTLGASALRPEPGLITTPVQAPFVTPAPFPKEKIATVNNLRRAAGQTSSMNFSPAGNPYTYTGLEDQQAGLQLAEAFQLTAAQTRKFAGNDITSIFFYTGVTPAMSSQQTVVNGIKKATLFLAYDLQNFEPFYTQTVDLPSAGLTLNSFTLDTPYAIEAGKPVYVGYYYNLSTADDLTLIIDAINHGNDVSGGWLGVRKRPSSPDDEPKWSFNNYSGQIGFFCLGATISGNNLPVDEVAVVATEVQPSVYENAPFDFSFIVTNNASNDISSIECQVTVGNDAPQTETMTFDQALGYNRSGIVTFTDLSYGTPGLETVPVSVTVTKVNGNDNTSTNATGTAGIQVIPVGMGYDRNVIVEEFTGTWCPNCPYGITAMETVRETYTDGSVIPVAIHYQDPMASTSFASIDNTYGGSYPSAIMNRMMYVDELYPASSCIEAIEQFKEYPAPAKVSATAHFNDSKNGIIFDAKTAFSFDNGNAADDYILAFAVTEDNVGPYEQKNGFSGTDMPYWGSKPSIVEVVYNDVARQLNSVSGITGSVPASVTAGEEYDFNYEMKFLASSKIANKDNLNAVVYLINRKTGTVENGCMIKSSDLAAINDVFADSDADANAPVEYFNLQGIRVARPANGIFIRRQGSKAGVVAVN